MGEFIQKISSYNIFNYLFSGIIFCAIVERFTQYVITQNNVFIDIFIFYFIGLSISRIGSLILEPILIKIKVLKSYDYKDYLETSKNYNEIKIFLEVANMYRTFLSMFIVFSIIKIYELISIKYEINSTIVKIFLAIGFIVLFLCSYIKQSKYILNRIKFYKNKNQGDKNGNS